MHEETIVTDESMEFLRLAQLMLRVVVAVADRLEVLDAKALELTGDPVFAEYPGAKRMISRMGRDARRSLGMCGREPK